MPRGGHNATPLTLGQYGKLLAAFREKPGVVNFAAKKVGVSPILVKQLWETGRQDRYHFARCIKEVLAEEQAAASAARLTTLQQLGADRALQRRDAEEVRLSEALAVEIQRRAAIQGAQLSERIIAALGKLGPRIAATLERLAEEAPDEPLPISMVEFLSNLHEQHARTASMIADATKNLLAMERQIAGKPPEETDTMSGNDAVVILAKLGDLQRFAASRGAIPASQQTVTSQ